MNLDSEIILNAYELADMIKESYEVEQYLQDKQTIEKDPEIIQLKKKLKQKKELYEETQRFGNYHPSFYETRDNVKKTLEDINKNPKVKKFREAEDKLNQLLYDISGKLAESISKSIMVVKDDNIIKEDYCLTGNCTACGLKGNCAI